MALLAGYIRVNINHKTQGLKWFPLQTNTKEPQTKETKQESSFNDAPTNEEKAFPMNKTPLTKRVSPKRMNQRAETSQSLVS